MVEGTFTGPSLSTHPPPPGWLYFQLGIYDALTVVVGGGVCVCVRARVHACLCVCPWVTVEQLLGHLSSPLFLTAGL